MTLVHDFDRVMAQDLRHHICWLSAPGHSLDLLHAWSCHCVEPEDCDHAHPFTRKVQIKFAQQHVVCALQSNSSLVALIH